MSGLQTAHSNIIGNELQAGFQNFVDQSAKLTATLTTGTPATGYFYSSIPARAQIPDITSDLRPSFGIERIMTQQITQLTNEFGASGEPVYSVVGDDRGLIRFVGPWGSAVTGLGAIVYPNGAGYAEVTFYGTGLNIITATAAATETFYYSYDGGSETTFTFSGSNVLVSPARNYAPNNPISVVQGLTLGVHTVKVRWAAASNWNYYGFEILNPNASSFVNINPGSGYSSGLKFTNSAYDSIHYGKDATNTTTLFPAGRGGRVVRYLKEDGTVGTATTAVNVAAAYLASTDHTNEEVVRTYNWREFGCGRTTNDDFSTTLTGADNRAFTLDDGTTTLAASNPSGYNAGFYSSSTSGFITLTFVGTGLDIFFTTGASALSATTTLYVDGVSQGALSTSNMVPGRNNKVCSGLPYGAHTIQFLNSSSGSYLVITNFTIYQPKKPSLPASAVEVCDYNVVATYSATSSSAMNFISTGVLRKMGTREVVYVGTWSSLTVNPSGFDSGWNEYTQTATAYFQYTFFGTGIEWKFPTGTYSYNATVTVTNAAGSTLNLSLYTTALLQSSSGLTWTASSGAIGGSVTGANFARLQISGLPPGLYTIKVLQNGTGGPVYADCLDVIFPTHANKTITGLTSYQTSVPIGSCSLTDSRKVGPTGVIPMADASTPGLLSTVAQTFGGPKTTTDALTRMAGGGLLSQATAPTLTSTSLETIVVASPTSAQTVSLPTTGVKAGRTFVVACSGATTTNYVTVKSSDGVATIMEFYGDGHVSLVALQDTPIAAAHWRVLDSADNVSLNITPTGLTDNSAIPSRIKRSGKLVTLMIGNGTAILRTKDGTSGAIGFGTVPSFLRPSTSVASATIPCVSSGTWIAGTIGIDPSTGTLGLWNGTYATNFPANQASNGIASSQTINLSWAIA